MAWGVTGNIRGPTGVGFRAPATLAYAATMTPDASSADYFRCTLTGNPTVNVPTGGTDGQRILFELYASAASRTVTFAGQYELGQNVMARSLYIPVGLVGFVCAVNRNGTYRLLATDAGG